MILHNPVRRIGLFVGCMLLCTMFTAHATSSEFVIPSNASPTGHEVVAAAGETITVNAVAYDITFVETQNGGSVRNIMRPMSRRARLIAMSSHDATRNFLRALENRDRLSVIALPTVTLISGQKGMLLKDTEVASYEVTVRDNDGVLSEIAVKRTEIHDGKEKTYQWEMSRSLPTNNRSSWFASGKLGNKEFALLVTAERTLHEHTLPTVEEIEQWIEQWKEAQAQSQRQEEMTQ